MRREAFALKIRPGKKPEAEAALALLGEKLEPLFTEYHIANASLWGVEDVIFGYMELTTEDFAAIKPVAETVFGALADSCDPQAGLTCETAMRLMYHDIGPVQSDKSLIRQRMFVTRLKPGCAEEYKRRHDGLIAGRGGRDSGGPETNFTIWYTGEFICGYCEIVKSMEHTPTAEENAATIAWETRGLEVMDWLTDDVDWIFGTKHEAIRRYYQQA